MKIKKSELEKLIKEELEAAIEEGFMDSLKGAAGALGAKAFDKVKGTGNLAQTVQAQKQITTMVQKLAKDGYGGPNGARALAQHLQQLAAEIMKDNPQDDLYEEVDEDEDDVMRKAADAKKASFFDRTDDQHDAIAKGRHKSHPGGIPKGTDFDPKKEKPQRRAGAAKIMRSRIREANAEE